MLTLTFTDQQVINKYCDMRQIPPSVYEAYTRKAFACLLQKGASGEVAEEIIQEAWIPLVLKLSDFKSQGEGALYAYFQRICLNKFFTYCGEKKKNRLEREEYKRFVQNDEDYYLSVSALNEEDTWQAQKEKLFRLMEEKLDEALSSKCRELIQYRYLDKLPHKKINQLIGSNNSPNASSAKSLLSRCMKRLRALTRRGLNH